MTILVKNSVSTEQPHTASAATPGAGGFGTSAASIADPAAQFSRALLTAALVLYPAMATAAIVIAAFVLSGGHLV